jgi:hypothetical protein
VTSREPDDLKAFCANLVEAFGRKVFGRQVFGRQAQPA